LFKINNTSLCGQCRYPDDDCRKIIDNGITDEETIFMCLGDNKYYTFMHDAGECGCMCEVDKISSEKNLADSSATPVQQTQPVICEKCGNDLSVDKRDDGCVSKYCPWCGTRKKQAGA